MTAVLFDTLKMVETLQAGGFTDQQARAMTSALSDAATVAAVATRGDVMDLGIGMKHDFDTFKIETRADFDLFKTEIRSEFGAFKTEMRSEFGAFKTEIQSEFGAFKTEMRAVEQRMTIRLGGMLVVLAGVLSAVFHYLR